MIVLIVTAVAHYLNGGIRFQSPFQRVTPQVKAHLSVILAVMALVKTAQYYLGRFELNFSTRGVVEGASYTDVQGAAPALNLLIFISIVAAALFLWNIRRRGLGAADHRGRAVGVRVDRDRHDLPGGDTSSSGSGPNEYQAEAPYIDRNIRAARATRSASTTVETEAASTSRRSAHIPADEATDGRRQQQGHDQQRPPVGPGRARSETYQTAPEPADLLPDRRRRRRPLPRRQRDRQVLIAARGLNSADLPSQSFVNRHIVYTHGYGVVASPSNAAERRRHPDFYLKDIPTVDQWHQALANGPPSQIYFAREPGQLRAHRRASQASSTTRRAGATDQFTRYKGKDGVKLSNFVRRAAFALRFGDLDPLISGQINSRHEAADGPRHPRPGAASWRRSCSSTPIRTPWCSATGPLWVLDGYTDHRQVPVLASRPSGGSGRSTSDFNYVRNSVKATVDAYQGTVNFYVCRPEGPDHPGVRQGVPRPVHRRDREMPAELREAPALPGGPLHGAGRTCSAATT